jgi:hypothetical protein
VFVAAARDLSAQRDHGGTADRWITIGASETSSDSSAPRRGFGG